MVKKQWKAFKTYLSAFRRFYLAAIIAAIVVWGATQLITYHQAKFNFDSGVEYMQAQCEDNESIVKSMQMDIEGLEKELALAEKEGNKPDYDKEADETQLKFLKEELAQAQYFYPKYKKDIEAGKIAFCYEMSENSVTDLIRELFMEKNYSRQEMVGGSYYRDLQNYSAVSNLGPLQVTFWSSLQMAVMMLFAVVVLLVLGWKWMKIPSKEFLSQLPFDRRQWFWFETIAGWVVSIGVMTVLSLLWGVTQMQPGHTGPTILQHSIYMMAWTSSLYLFVAMFKEFVRNNVIGVILGTVLFDFIVSDCLDIFYTNTLEKQVTIPVIIIAISLVVEGVAAGHKSIQQNHNIKYFVIRIFYIIVVLMIPWKDELVFGLTLSTCLTYLFFALVGYLLLDLRFIAGGLEKKFYLVKEKIRG